ncbi:MAG: nucleoside hydrolase [Rhodospirillales bacterium]|nr:nucleoside hydrolase [Rhodospirillales bacterium]
MTLRKVILDTDIGTDVDDILALTLLAKEPSIDLLGITTVYGDTLLRGRLAKRQCELLSRDDVKVYLGETEPMSGREIWWTGHEGIGMPDIERAVVETSKDGVSFLVDSAAAHAGELEVLAIGPMTNIAAAIKADPDFVHNVKHLHLMAGDFRTEGRISEHNVKCDVVAADIVMRSGMPITMYGLNVTTQVILREPELERIREAGKAGEVLAEQISIWWKFRDNDFNFLHDPLAALGMIGEPVVCEFERADCKIKMTGEIPGETLEEKNPESNIRFASDVASDAACKAVVDRICA